MNERVAITGGIGEGKSTVLAMIAEAGFETASSDEIARDVFALSEVQSQIADSLGQSAPVDRDLLREALARDETLRRRLNRITHPHIVARLRQSSAQFIEVPLLFEACIQDLFQRTWVVTCGPEEQERRLVERYGSLGKARELIATQLPSPVKLTFADYATRTNQPHANVHSEVKSILRRDFV